MALPLSWAQKRRLVVFLILGALFLLLIFIVYRGTFYRAPSCTDGVQDGGEAGVDCGGSCSSLCTTQVQIPVVRFVRVLPSGPNQTDIVAYIDNPNTNAAALNAPYTLELYGAHNTLLARKTSTVNLPPHSSVPVFLPRFYTGSTTPTNAFLTFNQTAIKWLKSTTTPPILPVSAIQVTTGKTPRITATITNPTAQPLYDVKVVILVFGGGIDAANNVLAASQTVVPMIPAQGTAPLTFTWNEPFAGSPVREEVFPLLPLPHS